MDRIDPTSNPIQFSKPGVSETAKSNRIGPEKSTNQVESEQQPISASAYAEIFDDQALEKLQKNLHAVSDLASQALERLKKQA